MPTFFFHIILRTILDREASTFMHIAQFCNYINDAHTASENILDASMGKPSVVTFLTGGKLIDKKLSSISFTGILDAIGISHEQINDFYGKFKKKWTFLSYAESLLKADVG